MLFDPMDSSLPGSSIHGFLQARILEWVAFLFSRRSSQRSNLCLLYWLADSLSLSYQESPLLLSQKKKKKKEIMAICSNMDGSRDHHIKGSPHLLNILFNILIFYLIFPLFKWTEELKQTYNKYLFFFSSGRLSGAQLRVTERYFALLHKIRIFHKVKSKANWFAINVHWFCRVLRSEEREWVQG